MNPNSTDPNNPTNSSPAGNQPDLSSSTIDAPTQNQDWSTLPQTTPPVDNSSVWTPPATTIIPSTSPLDNPFNVPIQPPTIDGGLTETTSPQSVPSFRTTDNIQTPQVQTQQTVTSTQPEVPTWQPTPSPILNQPVTTTLNPQDIYTASQPVESITPTPPAEQAPTDLSHLIPDKTASGQPEQPIYAPPITQPETLIVPPDGNEIEPNIPTEGNHSKIPKWVIGVGIGLLLAVAGTTAYFIWPGFSNTTSSQTPIEQTTQSPVTVPTSVIPTVTQTPSTPVNGTDSGFGAVDGNSSPSATPPTSAADLLRQRQQQGQ